MYKIFESQISFIQVAFRCSESLNWNQPELGVKGQNYLISQAQGRNLLLIPWPFPGQKSKLWNQS